MKPYTRIPPSLLDYAFKIHEGHAHQFAVRGCAEGYLLKEVLKLLLMREFRMTRPRHSFETIEIDQITRG